MTIFPRFWGGVPASTLTPAYRCIPTYNLPPYPWGPRGTPSRGCSPGPIHSPHTNRTSVGKRNFTRKKHRFRGRPKTKRHFSSEESVEATTVGPRFTYTLSRALVHAQTHTSSRSLRTVLAPAPIRSPRLTHTLPHSSHTHRFPTGGYHPSTRTGT